MSLGAIAARARPASMRRWSIAALALLLTAATGVAVLDAGWTAASATAVIIGVVGALETLAVLALRPPRLIAMLALPVLLAVTLAVPNLAAVPVPAHSSAITVLVTFVEAAATGLLGNEPWAFNVALATLLWACGAWAMEVALRGRRGALATAPCWAVLAVNVINSPAPGNAHGASAIAALLAVLLMAAVNLERLSTRWGHQGLPVLPGTGSRFALAGGVGAALVLLVALLAPPLTSADISGRIFNFGAAGGVHATSGPGPAGVGRAGTVHFDPATVPGGALALANVPVLTYRASTGAGVYLGMAADGVFESGNWLPMTAVDGEVGTEGSPAGPVPRDRTVGDGGVGGSVQRVSATLLITDDTSGSNTLPFAGEPDSSSVPAQVTGIRSTDGSGQLLTVDTAAAAAVIVGRSITTGATQSTATIRQLRAAGSAYPAFIANNFLQVADDGTGGLQVIRALAQQWTQAASTAYDKASVIETLLRNPQLFHYSLKPPLPNPTEQIWPVTYFLTISHTGYCQYFASSMGTMLRALGIPARLVNGYGPGTPPDSAVRTSGGAGWRVTSNDAHTWVEAYFPGYGWIPFEPTPPSQAGDYQTFPRGGATPLPVASSAPTARAAPTRTPARRTPTPAAADAGGGGDAAGPPALLSAVLAASAAIAVLLLVFTAWWLRPRDLRGVWRRVALVGRLVGTPRDRSATLAEYAAMVTACLPSDTVRLGHGGGEGPVGPRPLRRRIGSALAEIAAISDQALYGAHTPAPRDAVRMRRAWRRVARVLPALGWRVLLRRSTAP